MKKKTKHKKQQGTTHPISESERVKEILERMANHKEPTKLEYNKKPRKLRISNNVGETSDIHIDKKDLLPW